MQNIRDRVDAVRARQQRQWAWQLVSWGLMGGGLAGMTMATTCLLTGQMLPWGWMWASLVLGPLIGGTVAFLRPRPLRGAAVAIDRSCDLKDRVSTALGFISQGTAGSPLRELQVADAELHAAGVDPVAVAPIRTPHSWAAGLAMTGLALLIGFLANPREQVSAAVVQNDVVVAQAARMEESLAELEAFKDEDLSPEIEKLLQEFAEKIDDLKQPGLDPKEALAKFSEMEAALLEQQQQLSDPSAEAALQEVGEALSLAEPFQAAGEAMSSGEMEKAAEELAKLEMPELDRQTERALTEKLDQMQQNNGDGAQKKLKEAIGQVSQGMSSGDRSKFKDGMDGLAGECKKQGRRKKLSDLLRKQCQCLCECKCECESQCKNNAESNKKGGKNWGLASSGGEPGDKTAMLKTGPQMQITGEESAQGDVDVETEAAPEQQQEAVRQYRSQAEKYEQLSESVLDSEPIPLGHRQTIRRYFEMIRPQGAETDAVNEQTEVAK